MGINVSTSNMHDLENIHTVARVETDVPLIPLAYVPVLAHAFRIDHEIGPSRGVLLGREQRIPTDIWIPLVAVGLEENVVSSSLLKRDRLYTCETISMDNIGAHPAQLQFLDVNLEERQSGTHGRLFYSEYDSPWWRTVAHSEACAMVIVG
jgi:hypothetical protein